MNDELTMNITFTVKVNRKKWAATYGTGTDAASVHADVREYLLNAMQGQPGIEESSGSVALK